MEGSELDKQYGEHQHDGQGQHDHQAGKRFLLLLIEAAVFDHTGWQSGFLSDLGRDFVHRAAQIAPLQTRSHGDGLAEIFAP